MLVKDNTNKESWLITMEFVKSEHSKGEIVSLFLQRLN